ncbi:MAG: hypothetical protein LUD07_01845 [Clostridiales bacterium]|nr:hypothetical protein [Clostridiales bacterium]
MNTSGIVSQYGFLFQRKVFVLHVLKNMGVNQEFYFEGKDDIEVDEKDKVYGIRSVSSTYTQVKSGVVEKACFCKIIGNWLLLDSSEREDFVLFLEKSLKFEIIQEDIVKDIFIFIQQSRDKKKSSIARQVYDKYKKDDNTLKNEELERDIQTILARYETCTYSIDELDNKLEEVFFLDYCQDIVEYELAKKKRLERFLSFINQEINEAIKGKRSYSLIYPEFIKIITTINEEISDCVYKVNVAALKPRLTQKAKEIVEEKLQREVRQLYLVNSQDRFVVKGIVNELFYKDFREIYDGQKSMDISNIEEFAKENYDDVCYELGEEASATVKYFTTIKRTIDSDILPKGSIYTNGCYIYLTGDNVENEKQITWGKENEGE